MESIRPSSESGLGIRLGPWRESRHGLPVGSVGQPGQAVLAVAHDTRLQLLDRAIAGDVPFASGPDDQHQPFDDLDPVAVEGPGGISIQDPRSEEHTSELQSLMRISYAVFCLKKK